MTIKFFEVEIPVRVRESDRALAREHRLIVTVPMGASATEEDAVEALARKLGKLVDDEGVYEGG